jgi:DNA-binding response OmpR family regulator
VRILFAEDDADLRARLVPALAAAGFAVDEVDNGVDAEFMGDEINYDAVVLDLGLPQRNGLEVLRRWRARGNRLPVLVLTARDAWYEKVDGFKAGADDYLGKPFHVEELLARLNALVRRGGGQAGSRLRVGRLTLEEDTRTVGVGDGQALELTGTEFRLLRYLMANPGKVLSKEHLFEHLYSDQIERDSNLIEVYIRRLRRKLGEKHIVTVRGQGYVLRGGSE